MLRAARLLVCHSWFPLPLCFALFFPVVAVLEGVARHLLGTWTGAKDHMLQLAHRFLAGESSPVSGRPPRDLLPFPFYPASGVWEPVNFNEEGTRLRKVLVSSDLNYWLLFCRYWSSLVARYQA